VTRNLTVRGHPVVLPEINATDCVRMFRVKTNAHLTLEYLRMRVSQSVGWRRAREEACEGSYDLDSH
jgi:hypothetical protein